MLLLVDFSGPAGENILFKGSSMPKEEPRLSLCAASSKKAKDKSNSSTLLALRGTKDGDDSSRTGCSSEKDSGYSDGSDWQQTDVEDRRRNKSPSRVGERAESSQPGQTQELGRRKTGKPGLTTRSREQPNIRNTEDTELQQIQRRDQRPFRNGIREISSSASPHVVLLQQPFPVAFHLHNPSSRKSDINSHPGIAPHSSKKPPDASSSKHESQNLSKRFCTEQNGDDATAGLPEQHLHKQPRFSSSSRDHPSSSSNAVDVDRTSPSSPVFLPARGLHKNAGAGFRHRRFLNTLEILKQSGLLDVTLQTEELQRRNNAAELDIAQLRRHTELLCRAAGSQNNDAAAAWQHLHRVMAESGSYPDLQDLLNPSSSPPDPESFPDEPRAAESSEVPNVPSRPDQSSAAASPGNNTELQVPGKTSDDVTVTPPDSSTG